MDATDETPPGHEGPVPGDPLAWPCIRAGWVVVAAGGDELGRVIEVLGDKERDVFDGIELDGAQHAGPRFAAAADVAVITDGAVRLAPGARTAARR